jgi:hypothetical protein
MGAGDAGKKAEMPEPNRKDSGGTAKDTGEARQSPTARNEHVGIEEESLLEPMLGLILRCTDSSGVVISLRPGRKVPKRGLEPPRFSP